MFIYTFVGNLGEGVEAEEGERVDEVEGPPHPLAQRPRPLLEGESLGEGGEEEEEVQKSQSESKQGGVLEDGERVSARLFRHPLAPDGEPGADHGAQEEPAGEGNAYHSLEGGRGEWVCVCY